uniref:Rad50 n=1 Tax=Platynereis dumerilii TaxID=6359 RepID=C7SB53_PLADU|nr:Rad50 [Platynereis dumerilii]ACH87548.1 Rad50 [Platynereis dumerilii]
MSSIAKMSIQGVRSFGPDDKNRGLIEFYTPLTLILGPNGTGKTTIIECLKYMTTGDLPPGHANGSFVHDPKIANEQKVKGQVRLVFNDVRGTSCMAVRTMEVTQQLKKVQFKTLDGVLRKSLADGEHVDITSRHADLNREIPSLLGVSKAILENVIFCHQEESNWPLSEGKALKQKFDDIFATSRFGDALDEIRKLRMRKVKGDLNEAEVLLEATRDSIAKIDENIEPLKTKLRKINEKQNSIYELQRKVDALRFQKKESEQTQKDLRKNIKKLFTGTTRELEQQLRDFKEIVEAKEEELAKLKTELNKTEDKLEECGMQKSEILLEHGKLEQEQKQHLENVKKRDQTVKNVAGRYGILGFSDDLEDDDIQKFKEKLEAKCKEYLDSSKQVKAEFDKKERDIQKKVDEARGEKTKMETELTMKRDTMEKNTAEIKKLGKELQRVDASADSLNTVKNDLRRAEKDLEDLEKSLNVDELKGDIKTMQEDKLELDRKLKNLEYELDQLAKDSEARTQLDMFKKDKTSKQDQIRKMQQRQKKEQEVTKYKEQFLNICNGIENFDGELTQTETKIKQKREDLSLVQGTLVVLKKYIEKLRKDDAPCPLCRRNFDAQSEIDELIRDLEDKMENLPSKMTSVNRVIKESQEKYDKMQQLKPVRANVVDLDSKELPTLKDRQQSIENQMKTLKSDIAEMTETLEMKQNDESMARRIQPDLNSIDRFNMEIKDLDRKISTQSNKLTGSSSDRSVKDVNSERQDLQLIVENKNSEIEHKRKKINDHTEHRHKLSGEVNDLKSQKLAIENDVQQRQKLEEKRESLMAENDFLCVEIQDTEGAIEPVQEKIDKLMTEKSEIVKTRDSKFEQEKEKFTQAKTSQREITSLDETIKVYLSKGRDKVLQQNEKKMKKIEDDAQYLETQRQSVNEKMTEIQEDLHSQKFKERELKDNLTLKEKEEQCGKLDVDIKKLEDDLGGLEATTLEQDRLKLNKEYNDLDREKNQLLGSLRGHQDTIQRNKDRLKGDLFRDAEKKFQDSLITLKTTEMACSDLEKYYKALDRTIMSYHQKKMSEINKIIRELWRNTYKGHDIETIEIRSNEEEGSGAAAKRRSYNYRVVMLKGDTPIDMRGRCSAGQKVLASLIIRLALAETFCLNCGILALDEPTTNLDRENIESLAGALVDIIKSRSGQSNFQLVVITHDEDFVELLGRSDYVDYFFKVKKNKNGHSELSKTSIQDFSR